VSSLHRFIGEATGTAVLILLGGGMVAAITPKRSKALNAGWVAISFSCGFAVLTGAHLAASFSSPLSPPSPWISPSRAAPRGATPLPAKGGTDWGYAWMPELAPLAGGAFAGGFRHPAFI